VRAFETYDELAGRARFGSLARSDKRQPSAPVSIPARELAVLVGLAVAAAAAAVWFHVHVHIPGHQILFTAPLAALGLALVPRRLTGVIFAVVAVGVGLALHMVLHRPMAGGRLVQLATVGPLAEATLAMAARSRTDGAGLIAALGCSVLIANALAGVVAAVAGESEGGRSSISTITAYAGCGLVVGVITGLVLYDRKRQA
jgi:hypothetical protein